MTRPADLSRGAPDEGDALRRAERLFEAAAQSGIDLAGLDGDAAARRHGSPASVRRTSRPCSPAILTRLARVAADPYLRREKPYERLAEDARIGATAQRAEGRAAPAARRRAGAARRARARARARHRGRPRARAPRRRVLRRRDPRVRRRAARALRRAALHRRRRQRARRRPRRDRHGQARRRGAELQLGRRRHLHLLVATTARPATLSLHEYFAKLCTEITAALSRGHRGRAGVPRRSPAAARGCERARSRTRSRRPSATTRRSAGRGSARRGSRRGCRAGDRALGAEMLRDAAAVRVPAASRRRRCSTTSATSTAGSSASSCAARTASISRTARAASARSSSSCRRCS